MREGLPNEDYTKVCEKIQKVDIRLGTKNMGKGSKKRPSQVSRQEEELRWKLATGRITFKEFTRKRKELIKQGKWGPTKKLRF